MMARERVRLPVLGPMPTEEMPRATCTAARPCLAISCRKNTYLEVKASGAIKINKPHLEPDEVDPDYSCSVDVSLRRGVSLGEVGEALGLSLERARQIVAVAIRKLKDTPLGDELAAIADEEARSPRSRR